MDRRTKDRHELQLVCHIGAAKILSAPIDGVTENMSRDGMLMRWLENVPLPAIGSALTVEVDLPEGPDFGPRVMRCNSTVVRITGKPGERRCVGLRIEKVRFTKSVKVRKYDLASMPVATEKVS